MSVRALRPAAVIAMTVTALALLGATGATAAPERLSDVTPTTLGSSPSELTEYNGSLYFLGFAGGANPNLRQLYKSDGTDAGTESISKAYAGPLFVFGGSLYFLGADSASGIELWKTDGTSAGTAIVKDIDPGPPDSFPTEPTVVGNTLYFKAFDPQHGSELWKLESGGEPELVADLAPGPGAFFFVGGMAGSEGTLYFTAYDEEHGVELWESDGTEAGTKLVKDIYTGTESSNPADFENVGGVLYFTATDEEHGTEVWKVSGGGEPERVTDIDPGPGTSEPSGLTALAGTLYFAAADEEHGRELWRLNGLGEPELIKDIYPGIESSLPRDLTAAGGRLYFSARDEEHGFELWESDGTKGGTVMVRDIDPGAEDSSPQQFTAVSGRVFFVAEDGVHGRELWSTDGTELGTAIVRDVRPGLTPAATTELTAFANALFFAAGDGPDGVELWKSDGTEVGTAMVEDINRVPQSPPSELTAAGGLVYFAAEDVADGSELWSSDGTPGGTGMVKDIDPGPAGSSPREFANRNGTLFFTASDGVHGEELWTSDGTEAGTEMVKDINGSESGSSVSELVNVGGTLFFRADDGEHGTELWKSDGTEAGTAMVKDINNPGFSFVRELSDAGGTLLFVAGDEAHGEELWRSDGTEGGTEVVKDINPGAASSGPGWRFPPLISRRVYGLPMYFGANDGVHGYELWKTDGTEAGTVPVKDINPGPGFANPLTGFLGFGGLTFFVANDGTHGIEPWQTDGTESGTKLALDIDPGIASSLPTAREVSKGTIYFNANDGVHGYELWRSHGTENTTKLVKDINPGSASGFPGELFPLHSELTDLNGTLFFSADDGVHGEELWTSDGTAADTQQVEDIDPGPAGSAPRHLIAVGNSLYFFAEDGGVGPQLWRLDASTPLDGDADGIADAIDTEPAVVSNEFSDHAATHGTISDRAGLKVTVTDAAESDGVRIAAGPGAGTATLSVCAGFSLEVKAGTEAVVTCGSIRVEVVTGEATVVLEGGETVVSVPAGTTAKVTEEDDGSFKVENLGGGDVTITTDGEASTLTPGDPPLVLEPPVAVADHPSVDEDATATTIDVLSNDTDTDGGEMTIVSATQPQHGAVVVAGSADSLTYAPTPNYCGADSFRYTLNGGSEATVSVTVACVDDPPVAIDDTAGLGEDATATAIPVLANDTDIDGGPKAIASNTAPAHGSLAITGSGSGLTYAPTPNYCGADSFKYTLNGGSEATVSVTVACVDDPPVAAPDSIVIRENSGKKKVNVLANDTDLDGGPKSILSSTRPHHGKATIGGGKIAYKPKRGFCGRDSFRYTVTGGSSAKVSIKVTCRRG